MAWFGFREKSTHIEKVGHRRPMGDDPNLVPDPYSFPPWVLVPSINAPRVSSIGLIVAPILLRPVVSILSTVAGKTLDEMALMWSWAVMKTSCRTSLSLKWSLLNTVAFFVSQASADNQQQNKPKGDGSLNSRAHGLEASGLWLLQSSDICSLDLRREAPGHVSWPTFPTEDQVGF